MSKRKDYTLHSFIIAIMVIALILMLNFIPELRFGSVVLKRVNIFSDIVDNQNDDLPIISDETIIDTTDIVENMTATTVADISSMSDSLPEIKTVNWDVSAPGLLLEQTNTKQPKSDVSEKEVLADMQNLVAIEDFALEDGVNMSNFYNKLHKKQRNRPLRIGVFGDSFIEGDIITADLREQLQTLYGGRGVGFIPLASDVLKYRATVKHASSGWKVSNLMQRKSAPGNLRDKFSVSGFVCTATDGAFARFEGVTYRKQIKRYSTARLLFINEYNSTVNMTINDSVNKVFTPQASPYIQQISVSGDITSVKISVNEPEGFIGYGVVLEDTDGVSVDNYSIRGNSGMALVATNSSINSQINNAIGYDLIVLQYGLNAMAPNVLSYATYSRQMCKIIEYMKGCFPSTPIVVMGVGDRSTQTDGKFVTMPAVGAMLKAQRGAAERSGVAFWSIFEAMGGDGSMVQFVKKNWAAKDYTHIGYAGGKYIAKQFVKALLHGKEQLNANVVVPAADIKAVLPRAADPLRFTPNQSEKSVE